MTEQKLRNQKLISIVENAGGIKGTGQTWEALGKLFNMSGEAARSVYKRRQNNTPNEKEGAKVLIFDIESTPLAAYTWGLFKQNININHLQDSKNYFMLCWSAKWLFDDEVMSDTLTPEEAIAEDDYRVTASIWKLLDEADVVIAHYGSKFDVPMLNNRFIMHGFPPPSDYRQIDTCRSAKKHFRFPSNKLDYIAQQFGVGEKIATSWQLWKSCMAGDKQALTDMSVYCDQDVKILEDVYLRMRPYIKPHPNLGMYILDETERCPTCTSSALTWDKYYYTNTSKYQAFRCENCGATGRSRKTCVTKAQRPFVTSPIPR